MLTTPNTLLGTVSLWTCCTCLLCYFVWLIACLLASPAFSAQPFVGGGEEGTGIMFFALCQFDSSLDFGVCRANSLGRVPPLFGGFPSGKMYQSAEFGGAHLPLCFVSAESFSPLEEGNTSHVLVKKDLFPTQRKPPFWGGSVHVAMGQNPGCNQWTSQSPLKLTKMCGEFTYPKMGSHLF